MALDGGVEREQRVGRVRAVTAPLDAPRVLVGDEVADGALDGVGRELVVGVDAGDDLTRRALERVVDGLRLPAALLVALEGDDFLVFRGVAFNNLLGVVGGGGLVTGDDFELLGGVLDGEGRIERVGDDRPLVVRRDDDAHRRRVGEVHVGRRRRAEREQCAQMGAPDQPHEQDEQHRPEGRGVRPRDERGGGDERESEHGDRPVPRDRPERDPRLVCRLHFH
nr:hypothetical protein [Halosegnis longus]